MSDTKSEVRDGMRIDWNVGIEMNDDLVLSADVFRPKEDGKYPVLLSYGPYGKGLSFQEGYPTAWKTMVKNFPEVSYGSTNKYQNWEVVDPEKWVPEGYVVIRVDSRGCGRSPGYIDHFSQRETDDYYQCIEWAGTQSWSNGKVGLNGISYYAMNQWLVACEQPPHLAAMCIWEGAADWYRDSTHHGGILSTFWDNWYDMQVKRVQYGLGERGPKNIVTEDKVCGDINLSDQNLEKNRCYFGEDIISHPLDDEYHKERSPKWDKIEVPILSTANWGGQGLHTRGNFEGFVQSASSDKWLEVHGLEHWTHFYTDYGIDLQKRFFDYFLKDKKNNWDKQSRVQLLIRHTNEKGKEIFKKRKEKEWPIPRTDWTKFYLDPDEHRLLTEKPDGNAEITFDASGEGITFISQPMQKETEITGPLASKLFVSSSTSDADIFLVFRVFTPDMREVTFHGAIDPNTPIAQGWLRASHRKIDPELSEFYRPYHTHDEIQLLELGKPVELDVEIWPTSIVVPCGYRIGLSIRGKDYEYAKQTGNYESNFKNELLGCGPFLHNDPRDRKPEVYQGETTIHFEENKIPYVLVPIIPDKKEN